MLNVIAFRCLAVLCLLLVSGQAFAIEYATGSRVNTTVTQVTGTRGEAVQLIEPVLTGVGWTVVSGGGTTDVTLQSGTTPQGYSMRVRIYDSGAGNSFRLKPSNGAGTTTMASDFFLLPAVGRVWRIIANQYQFFLLENGSAGNVSRRTVMMGVPYVPSWNVPLISNSIVWAMGDGSGDADATARSTFRDCPSYIGCNVATSHAQVFQLINTGAIEGINANTTAIGGLRLLMNVGTCIAVACQPSARRFLDDSYFVSDPWLAMDTTSFASEGKVVGMLWDSMIVTNYGLTPDTTFTFDGHTWYVLTVVNALTATGLPGQICVRVS